MNTTFYQLVRLLEKELDLVIPHMMAEDATSDTKACAGQCRIKLMRVCLMDPHRLVFVRDHLRPELCDVAAEAEQG